MAKKRIIFELSILYFQKQKRVSKKVGRTIINMICATILDRNIDGNSKSEKILAMTQMKNIRPIKALKGNSPYKLHFKKLPDINYLQVLRSTIYVFIYKK